MKYVLGIILALALILPMNSLAADSTSIDTKSSVFDSDFFPVIPWGIAAGVGSEMFSTGVDLLFGKKAHIIGPLMWSNRIRMIYDYEDHQYGALFQPNLRFVWFAGRLYMFTAVIGPEIGWKGGTGFEYGASIRIGGLPALMVGNYEVGYLVNSKRFYATISFCFAPGPLFHFLWNGYHG